MKRLLSIMVLLGLMTLPASLVSAQTDQAEITFWESVKDSKDKAEFEAYLQAYPNGKFSVLARLRLKKLSSGAPQKNTESKPVSTTKSAIAEGPKARELKVTLGGISGRPGQARIGIHLAGMSRTLVKALEIPARDGILITKVVSGGPGENAGLRAGTVITAIDGDPMKETNEIVRIVGKRKPGDQLSVSFVQIGRSGKDYVAKHRRIADETGDAEITESLASIYRLGYLVPKDLDEAEKFYRIAADLGRGESMFALGVMLDTTLSEGKGWSRQNAAEAFGWYLKAAKKGVASAAYNVANLYSDGHGVELNLTEAAHWYKQAAEGGHADAMFNYAWHNDSGSGVEKNKKLAAEWYRRAAEKGKTHAMHNLGNILQDGEGVRKDFSEAVKWYKKAADGGSVSSFYGLATIFGVGGNGVALDYGAAAKYLLDAYKRGSNEARHMLLGEPKRMKPSMRREIQKHLANGGFYRGPIDGDLGSGSQKALLELKQNWLEKPEEAQPSAQTKVLGKFKNIGDLEKLD